MPEIVDKLGDLKNGVLAGEVLTSMAEATKFDLIATEILCTAMEHKNPKVQQEALLWLSNAMKEFGVT